MSRREAIYRYNLIIQKLRKGPATFAEISGYLQRESELQEYKFNMSLRTFQRDINDIRTIYDIDISCNRSQKKYCIDTEGQQEVQDRILEAFDTMNALPEEVILSFTPDQGKYIKSLLLNDLPQIVADDDRELRISLKLHVTFDFVQEILSHGPEVKVIPPDSLVTQVRSSYENSLNRYR